MSRKMPIIHNRAVIAETRQFRIESLELEFSSGELRQYERLAKSGTSGAVLVVPMLDHNTVLLIRIRRRPARYELVRPKAKSMLGRQSGRGHQNQGRSRLWGPPPASSAFVSLAPAYREHTIDIILAEDLYPKN